MKYKELQQEFRDRAKAIRVLWISPRGSEGLRLGINAFKRTEPDAKKRIEFKQKAWDKLKGVK